MNLVVKYYLKTILLGFALVLGCASAAQDRGEMKFSVSSLGYQERISSKITRAVRDTLGFYWLASWEGLYYFNGRQAGLYDLPYLQMKANKYFKLEVDANGMFWYYSRENPSVGFRVAQVRIFDPYRKKACSLKEYLPDLPFDPQAITYLKSQGNRIFIGVNEQEVYEFGAEGLHAILKLPQNERIMDLDYYAADTAYFLLTSTQLLRFTPAGRPNAVPGLPQSVFSGEVEMKCNGNAIVFYEEKNRELVGLYFPAHAHFEQLGNSKFLGCDEQGALCVSSQKSLQVLKTSRAGSWTYSLEVPLDELFSEGETPQNVTFLDGDLWTFFHQGGKIIRPRPSFFTNYLEHQNYSIRDIFALSDTTVLLTTYNGNKVLNLNNGSHSSLFSTMDAIGFGVGIQPAGRFLYIGMHHGGGLFSYDRSSGAEKILPFAPESRSLAQAPYIPFADDSGQLWVGLESGLARLDTQLMQLQVITKPELAPLHEAEFKAVVPFGRDFWLATSTGLWLFDPRQEQLVDALTLLPDRPIIHAFPQSEDSIWVVPRNDQLFLWTRSAQTLDTIRIFRPEWQNSLHAILPDAYGAYWLPSNNGLFRYDTRDGRVDRFTREEHGLPNNEFNSLAWEVLPDGKLALGTVNGMTVLDPAEFADRSFRAPTGHLRFTSVKEIVGTEERLIPDTAFQLSSQAQFFSANTDQLIFQFKYLDPFATDVTYYYRLDAAGSDASWQRLLEPKLIFNRLGLGTHQLEIAVRIGMDQVFIDRQMLLFRIQRPWYFSWWMIALYLLAVVVAFRLAVRLWTRKIEREKKALEAIIQERTEKIRRDKQLIEEQHGKLEKLNAAKDKLFAILGHEFRTPLISVMNLSKSVAFLLRNRQFEQMEVISRQIDVQAENVHNLLVNTLTWSRTLLAEETPEPADIVLVQLVNDLIGQFRDMCVRKNIVLDVVIPADQIISFDRESLTIVLRNLLHNALKFSPPQARVRLEYAHTAPKTNRIIISDQGKGFSDEFLLQWQRESEYISVHTGTAGEKGSGLGLFMGIFAQPPKNLH